MNVSIALMTAADWPVVAAIYAEGIATGQATFAAAPPETFADFSEGKLTESALVARSSTGVAGEIVGWAALSKVSDRCVYAGVAEVSLYVATARRGRGVGAGLLRELIVRSEAVGVWMLQAGIFPENTASIALHEREGFRIVGRRERLGKMTFGPQAGRWRDVLLLERRSAVMGCH